MKFSIFRVVFSAALLFALTACQNTKKGTGGGGDPLAMDYPFDENGNYIESAARNMGSGGSSVASANIPPAPAGREHYVPIPDSTPPPPAPTHSSSSTRSKPKPSTVRYTVKRGDTLSSIARRYGTSISSIRSTNGISGDLIRIGQTLRISKGAGASRSSSSGGSRTSSGTRYTVRSGDSLWKIANKYGTSVSKLKSANGLRSDVVRPGQKLKIP